MEVSDSTLAYDKNVKLPLYANAGVPEGWIVDLAGRRVEVHSEPSPQGYRVTRTFTLGERVGSPSVEKLAPPVDEILD